MIPTYVLASLRQLVVLMEKDRDRWILLEKECAKQCNHTDGAYWKGKIFGTVNCIGILRDRIESWEAMNEYELEDMADDEYEKSEKDALWGGE